VHKVWKRKITASQKGGDNLKTKMSKEYQEYISHLESQLEEVYQIARKARERRVDPTPAPEPERAKDMASLVEGLVGPTDVAESIRELSKTLTRRSPRGDQKQLGQNKISCHIFCWANTISRRN